MQPQQLWCSGVLAHDMWDLPGSGIEPVSPALAGRLLTTGPPGKPRRFVLEEMATPSQQEWAEGGICGQAQDFPLEMVMGLL